MKATIPTAFLATQAEIDAGVFTAKSGGIIIVVDADGQDSGVRYEVGPANVAPAQIITSSGNVAGGALKAWAANTTVEAGEIRRATVAVGTIGIGDFISSNTARTTGAVFNTTEAANWTELPDDPDLTAHKGDTANPHGVTAVQLNLGNVNNTADTAKPVSTAQQTALDLKQDASTAATDTELSALTATVVSHGVNTSNPHTVTKAQVGLGSAENTSDANKPVSTAQQTALNAKLTYTSIGTLDANSTALTDNAVYIGQGNGAVTNGPTGAWAWTLFNFRMGSWRTQIFIPGGSNIIYKRTVDGTFTGATWQSLTFA